MLNHYRVTNHFLCSKFACFLNNSCYLVLGEIENALVFFNKCLESEAGVCLDRRIRIDAAGGLQKAQVLQLFLLFLHPLVDVIIFFSYVIVEVKSNLHC